MASIQFYKFNSDPREVRTSLPSATAATTLSGVTMGFPDGTIRVDLDAPPYDYTHFGVITAGSTPGRIYRITSATWINSKAWEIDYAFDGAVTAYYKAKAGVGGYDPYVILTRTTDANAIHKFEYDPSYPLGSSVTVTSPGSSSVPMYLTIVIWQPDGGTTPLGVYGSKMVSPRVFQAEQADGAKVYRAITASTAGTNPDADFIASCIKGIYLMPKIYAATDVAVTSITIDKYGTSVPIPTVGTVHELTTIHSVGTDAFPITPVDFTAVASDFTDCSPCSEYVVFIPGGGFFKVDTQDEALSSVGLALYPDPLSGTISIFQRINGATRFERGGTKRNAISVPIITTSISNIRIQNDINQLSQATSGYAGAMTSMVGDEPGIGFVKAGLGLAQSGAGMFLNAAASKTQMYHAGFNLDGGGVSDLWSCNAQCWKIKRSGILSTSDFWGYYGGICGDLVKISTLTTSKRHWIDARYAAYSCGETEGLRIIEDLSHGIYPM